MTPCYYCEADDDACKTCIHSGTYIDPQEEITKLREQVAAQASVIEALRAHLKVIAGLQLCVDNLMSNSDIAAKALSIPTDSTQILDEVRRQALSDTENQPNQYGVEFGMHGEKMMFKIGCQQFTLDYSPDEQDEFECMKKALIHAFSTFTPDVKIDEVRLAERERVAQYVQQGTGDWMLGKKIAAAIRAME